MAGEVKLNARGLTDLLRSPQGPVMRDLLVRATRVQAAARQLAPKATGDLANSVVKRPSTFAGKPAVLVGVDNPKRAEVALIMEEGSAPHVIRPRSKRALAFYSKKVGGRIVVRSVKHPGTKPYRWLSRALERARG